MTISFDHRTNQHTLDGPRAVLPVLLSRASVHSLLDVGCGVGTWTKVALELGVQDVLAIDGVRISQEQLLVEERLFKRQDLRELWSLGRRFDLVLCLEVAEHLEGKYAAQLIRSLTAHGDVIAFSAACPGQVGQHHVNCRWPDYWQDLFNAAGFWCDDSIRWQVWNALDAEPWYRQNLFLAVRNPERAGHEPRLRAVVHPEFLFGRDYQRITAGRFGNIEFIEGGGMPVAWYLKAPLRGVTMKLAKRLKRIVAGPGAIKKSTQQMAAIADPK